MHPVKISALVVAAVSLAAAPALANRFTADDVVRVTRVSDPQISPDGKSIVIVVGHPNFKTDKIDTELVLVDIATHAQRVLTHDRVVGGYPRWSPTGDRIAYIAQDSDHKAQIFILPLAGGDSLQLTHAADAVTQFAWKPDGSAIAFAAVDDCPSAKAKLNSLTHSRWAPTIRWCTGPRHPRTSGSSRRHGGDAKRLTSGTWSLPVTFPPGSPASPINWTPTASRSPS
jgi:dipeptidyl aminopeptidase/acylaminoacyl peptidase